MSGISRRSAAKLLGAIPLAASAQDRIDRRAVVERHKIVLTAVDSACPLSIGNGEFAFTADPTGMQTLADHYATGLPLCTQSQWGWHTFPNRTGKTAADFHMTEFDADGRKIGYATSGKGQEPLYNYLRDNPHRLHLGRIWLARRSGGLIGPGDLSRIRQELDLWTGVLTSSFFLDGAQVQITSCCHPTEDMLAFEMNSTANPDLEVRVAFPYGSPGMDAANWQEQDRHSSILEHSNFILRTLDGDSYSVAFSTGSNITQAGRHLFLLRPDTSLFQFAVGFAPKTAAALAPKAIFDASRKHWPGFWTSGAFVEMPGQKELERRTILSQYQTAIQCSGSMPPQETGLACNSWNGKFHLEMHLWHAAHFPMWNRPELLQRSLGWYQSILNSAIAKAKTQGYAGARWPKMTAADGFDSPSPIGPMLIWQQPHIIFMADMLYRLHPKREILNRYQNLVFASADFMATYASVRDGKYWLGPPVIPAQENHPPRETWNPTFELEYWHEGLRIASAWRTRLQLPPRPNWIAVQNGLADLPMKDGVYLAHANCPQTFAERNTDHPSMLMALGMLPGRKVDSATMGRTLDLVMKTWKWEHTWGWDFGAVAMTAMRLKRPDQAIEILLMDTPKNKWLANGHTPQRANLPCYLPTNGALLAAVAMMASDGLFRSEGIPRLL